MFCFFFCFVLVNEIDLMSLVITLGYPRDDFCQIPISRFMGHTFPFLCMFCNFLLLTAGYSEYYSMVTL